MIVDVRRTKEAADKPLRETNIHNVPFEEFRVLCEDVPKDKDVVCICSKGVPARVLKDKGCTGVKYVGGGALMKPA